MARIAGVDLPRNKRVDIALTAIYGIGRYTASQIVNDLDIDPGKKVDNLAENEVSQLRDKILDYKIEGICGGKLTRILNASWISTVIVACVTVGSYLSAVSVQTQTLAPVKGRHEQFPSVEKPRK